MEKEIINKEELINSINNLTDEEMEKVYALSPADAERHLHINVQREQQQQRMQQEVEKLFLPELQLSE